MWMVGMVLLKEASYEDVRIKTFSDSLKDGIAKGCVAGLFRCYRKRRVSPETGNVFTSRSWNRSCDV